jgi:hypothetical protein
MANSEDLTIEKLLDLVDPKNPPLLKELGGPETLTKRLGSDVEKVIHNNHRVSQPNKLKSKLKSMEPTNFQKQS